MRKDIKEWIIEHKTELIIASVIAVSVVGTIVIIKRIPKKAVHTAVEKTIDVVEKTSEPIIPSDIANQLTGTRLTPTKLGKKVYMSPQAINKKLVERGFQIRYPSGGYYPTKAGECFAEEVLKCTGSGYVFSNLEWDEKVLEYLFSEEEMKGIKETLTSVSKLKAKFAA